MAGGSIAERMPPADSIWRCPCGYQDTYIKVRSHRKGYKDRPQCAGKMRPLDSSLLYTELASEIPASPQPPIKRPKGYTVKEAAALLGISQNAMEHRVSRGAVPAQKGPDGLNYVDVEAYRAKLAEPKYRPTPREDVAPVETLYLEPQPEPEEAEDGGQIVDDLPSLNTDDPEELARRFNARRGLELGGVTLLTREQMGIDEPPPTLPPGDWTADSGVGPVAVSQDRLSITLPVQVRIMFDWAISQGWHVGDGSLSAFVADCLFDHFNGCWGMGIFVAPLEEVDHAERGPVEPRPASQGRSTNAPAVGQRS